MNGSSAQKTLQLYRPGTEDANDPEFADSLQFVEKDAELKKWFEIHCTNYLATRAKLQTIQPPQSLLQDILRNKPTLRPPFWQRLPAWTAAAAILVLLATMAILAWNPWSKDRLDNFRSRMVSNALRQYNMDILTNNADVVRQFMVKKGRPADYKVPDSLNRLSLTGGGALRWRNNPVSMVCYDRGDGQMLFLFVVKREALRDAPGDSEKINAQISRLHTISWSDATNAYVLAGPEESDFYEKYP